MPDTPQPSTDTSRIKSMLTDLNQQRQQGSVPAAPQPAPAPIARPTPPPAGLPVAPTPVSRPPVNLPTPPAPMAPRPAPVTPQAPLAPMPPRPVVPPAPAPIAPVARPTAPVAPQIPSGAAMPPKPATPPPAAPKPPMPAVQPSVAPRSSTPQPGGYTAQLRTMAADIGNLKVGQQPQAMRSTAPAAPSMPAPVVSAPGRPITAPSAPVAPSAAAPMAPRPPAAPAPTISAPTITIAPPIGAPAPSGGGRGRIILMIVLGVVVLGAFIAIVASFFGSGSTTTPTPTTSASALPTATPTVKTIQSYFGVPTGNATISDSSTAVADFRNVLATLQPAARQAMGISVQQNNAPLSVAAALQELMVSVPASVSASLGSDWGVFAYGQTELFDTAGQKSTDTTTQVRPLFIIEVANATQANQAMQTWETSGFIDSAKGVMGVDPAKQLVTGFSAGTYRQIPVRYANFSYADRSLDWAIVLASNGKNYLIISGSRESIFFAIDQFMQ